MFLGWNVGCILALKAALVCSVSSIICMSPPFLALSEESKVKNKIFFVIKKKYDHLINRMILLKSMLRFYLLPVKDNIQIKLIIIVKD